MTATQADIDLSEHRGHPLVRVRGEVDMSNATLVGDQIRTACAGPQPIVLDLEQIEFFDSSGLHMLQTLSHDLEQAGGELTVIAAPDSIVGRLLTLTRMDTQLRVRATLPA
jgi:anti-anti-sigma factor